MREQKDRTVWVKRTAVYILGVVLMTFGIALTIRAGVGVAPASAVSYAMSKLTPMSVGVCTTLFHTSCIVAQLFLTRRLTLSLVLQLPLALVFGQLIDFFLWVLPEFSGGIAIDILALCAGMLVFSLGIRAIAGAKLLLMPSDNLARSAGALLGWRLPKSKLVFDIICTVIALVLMLISSDGVLTVIGIGTIICAAATGPSIGLYNKLLPFLDVGSEENS